MTEVLVTRKGQTTIPVEMRRKYAIEEGSRLEVIDTGDGILLKPEQTTADLAGSGLRRLGARRCSICRIGGEQEMPKSTQHTPLFVEHCQSGGNAGTPPHPVG